MKHKKGNAVLDSIVIVVVVLVFTIAGIVGYKVFTDLNTDVQADLTNADAKSSLTGLYNNYLPLIDNAVLFIYVLLLTFTIITVFMLDTHPIFFVITLIMIIAFFMVVILLANAYDEMMTDSDLSSSANQFTYAHWVFTHLVELSIATGFIIMIALFIKFKG